MCFTIDDVKGLVLSLIVPGKLSLNSEDGVSKRGAAEPRFISQLSPLWLRALFPSSNRGSAVALGFR
jgi:hypothetical protein